MSYLFRFHLLGSGLLALKNANNLQFVNDYKNKINP